MACFSKHLKLKENSIQKSSLYLTETFLMKSAIKRKQIESKTFVIGQSRFCEFLSQHLNDKQISWNAMIRIVIIKQISSRRIILKCGKISDTSESVDWIANAKKTQERTRRSKHCPCLYETVSTNKYQLTMVYVRIGWYSDVECVFVVVFFKHS